MTKLSRNIITLISSLLICTTGIFRLMNNTDSQATMYVAYIFAIAGFIGVVANGILLKRVLHEKKS